MTTAKLPFTAGGLCGGVRFSLETAPTRAYCHCTRCRKRTGAASFVQARVDGLEPFEELRPS